MLRFPWKARVRFPWETVKVGWAIGRPAARSPSRCFGSASSRFRYSLIPVGDCCAALRMPNAFAPLEALRTSFARSIRAVWRIWPERAHKGHNRVQLRQTTLSRWA